MRVPLSVLRDYVAVELPVEGTALIVRSGGGRQGEMFTIGGDRTSIGRSPDAELVAEHAGPVAVTWLPQYHDMGLIGAWLGSLYFGCPLVLMSPTAFLVRPARWLRAIHDYRATLSGAPNFGYELCTARVREEELRGLDLSSWRVAFNGARPIPPARAESPVSLLRGVFSSRARS